MQLIEVRTRCNANFTMYLLTVKYLVWAQHGVPDYMSRVAAHEAFNWRYCPVLFMKYIVEAVNSPLYADLTIPNKLFKGVNNGSIDLKGLGVTRVPCQGPNTELLMKPGMILRAVYTENDIDPTIYVTTDKQLRAEEFTRYAEQQREAALRRERERERLRDSGGGFDAIEAAQSMYGRMSDTYAVAPEPMRAPSVPPQPIPQPPPPTVRAQEAAAASTEVAPRLPIPNWRVDWGEPPQFRDDRLTPSATAEAMEQLVSTMERNARSVPPEQVEPAEDVDLVEE